MKLRTALPLALVALPLLLISRRGADAETDAVTAASISVSVSNILATSATVDYSRDRYDYGTRTLCYDPAPTVPTHNCATKDASGNAGSFTLTGLKAGTQYNFNITASDGRHKDYATSGTFKTLVATALAAPGTEAIGSGDRIGPQHFDAKGRFLDAPGARNGKAVIFTNRMARPTYR